MLFQIARLKLEGCRLSCLVWLCFRSLFVDGCFPGSSCVTSDVQGDDHRSVLSCHPCRSSRRRCISAGGSGGRWRWFFRCRYKDPDADNKNRDIKKQTGKKCWEKEQVSPRLIQHLRICSPTCLQGCWSSSSSESQQWLPQPTLLMQASDTVSLCAF